MPICLGRADTKREQENGVRALADYGGEGGVQV